MGIKEKRICVITGNDYCYGTVDAMSKEFAKGLKECGCNVNTLSYEELLSFANGNDENFNYDIVIEIMGNFFKFQKEKLKNVLKFSVITDSMFSLTNFEYFRNLQNIFILNCDEGETDYINNHLEIAHAFHFPFGGMYGKNVYEAINSECGIESLGKKYDLTFIGSYMDYRDYLMKLNEFSPELEELALNYFDFMLENYNYNSPDALRILLSQFKLEISEDDFWKLGGALVNVEQAVAAYYREKTIGDLLKGGIRVDVFSEEWNRSKLSQYSNLKVHKSLFHDEMLDVMSQSKISLNIMKWHKGGMTERISNIMFNGAVCATDVSSYLIRNFSDMDDILMFDLKDTEHLLKNVYKILSDDSFRTRIVKNAFSKISENYSWNSCARRFIDIADEIIKEKTGDIWMKKKDPIPALQNR
ncbi:MAG: glycosyltransferase [Lachnospiraceae bacterium]|nr:glycosyltransferase [Lachnospiraceae bacterium]